MPDTMPREDNAIQTTKLGKRYGSYWALQDCTINVPRGGITALVGPNGAGKTTLLKQLVGLARPTTGTATVLGHTPGQTSGYLADIGYLAQEIPLYRQLTAADHITMGAHLNQRWDGLQAQSSLRELGIPLNRPVGLLSGGQRSQVALALALAKKPRLLVLDEPVAALDPLARVDFLTSLTRAAADARGDLTVIMSSHLLADLERVCDHLVILATGKTQLCDSIEHAISTHKLLVGRRDAPTPPSVTVVKEVHAANATHLLVHLPNAKFRDPHWQVQDVDIEDIVLAYMGQNQPQAVTMGEVR